MTRLEFTQYEFFKIWVVNRSINLCIFVYFCSFFFPSCVLKVLRLLVSDWRPLLTIGAWVASLVSIEARGHPIRKQPHPSCQWRDAAVAARAGPTARRRRLIRASSSSLCCWASRQWASPAWCCALSKANFTNSRRAPSEVRSHLFFQDQVFFFCIGPTWNRIWCCSHVDVCTLFS